MVNVEMQLDDYVLFVSHDIVGSQMAGPGIRYYHLARTLGREAPVVLAVPYETQWSSQHDDFRVARYQRGSWDSIQGLIRGARVVIIPSDTANDFPSLSKCDVPIVVDGYDPLLAEWLFISSADPEVQHRNWSTRMSQLGQQYLIGDFFICASERQRDWWLGLLEASGRINPWTFGMDPTLRGLVDVVAYGLPETPPLRTRPAVKGIWGGINPQDHIVLWGGGLWPWLDPLTAIRSIAKIWTQRQDVKLIFPGTRHPNPAMANMPSHNQAARELAIQVGLLDRAIFFGDWVPFEEWPNVLLDCDVALTLHCSETIEARLAFRSRVLDYIWAGLPVVATRGDATSEFIAERKLGNVVDSEDGEGVARAILELLDAPRVVLEERFARARQELTWERAAKPLIEFCRSPRRAPDKTFLGTNLANPFYNSLCQLQEEVKLLRYDKAQAESLIKAYRQRRVVRLVDSFHETLHRLGKAK